MLIVVQAFSLGKDFPPMHQNLLLKNGERPARSGVTWAVGVGWVALRNGCRGVNGPRRLASPRSSAMTQLQFRPEPFPPSLVLHPGRRHNCQTPNVSNGTTYNTNIVQARMRYPRAMRVTSP